MGRPFPNTKSAVVLGYPHLGGENESRERRYGYRLERRVAALGHHKRGLGGGQFLLVVVGVIVDAGRSRPLCRPRKGLKLGGQGQRKGPAGALQWPPLTVGARRG